MKRAGFGVGSGKKWTNKNKSRKKEERGPRYKPGSDLLGEDITKERKDRSVSEISWSWRSETARQMGDVHKRDSGYFNTKSI